MNLFNLWPFALALAIVGMYWSLADITKHESQVEIAKYTYMTSTNQLATAKELAK